MKHIERQESGEISVANLCKEASINRTTFYAHYDDTYDLLCKTEKQNRRKFEVNLQKQFGESSIPSQENMSGFLQYIEKNQKFYRACLQHCVELPVDDYLSHLWEVVGKPWKEDKWTEEYYSAFYRAGVSALLAEWLKQGCANPAEDIHLILLEHLTK